jgi:hypothetical protein
VSFRPRLSSLARADFGPFAAFPPPNGKNDDGSPLNRPQEFNGTLPGEEHIDKNAFDHPATYEVSSSLSPLVPTAADSFLPSQGYPTIWIPQDSHGFTAAELEATQAAGVGFSLPRFTARIADSSSAPHRSTSRPREPS